MLKYLGLQVKNRNEVYSKRGKQNEKNKYLIQKNARKKRKVTEKVEKEKTHEKTVEVNPNILLTIIINVNKLSAQWKKYIFQLD